MKIVTVPSTRLDLMIWIGKGKSLLNLKLSMKEEKMKERIKKLEALIDSMYTTILPPLTGFFVPLKSDITPVLGRERLAVTDSQPVVRRIITSVLIPPLTGI